MELTSTDIGIIRDDIEYKVIRPIEPLALENICYKDGKQKRRERRKQERNKKKNHEL